jgi:hypothetical protein
VDIFGLGVDLFQRRADRRVVRGRQMNDFVVVFAYSELWEVEGCRDVEDVGKCFGALLVQKMVHSDGEPRNVTRAPTPPCSVDINCNPHSYGFGDGADIKCYA